MNAQKLFLGLIAAVITARKGLLSLFKGSATRFFLGDEVTWDSKPRGKFAPKAKKRTGAFTMLQDGDYKQYSAKAPTYKEMIPLSALVDPNRRLPGVADTDEVARDLLVRAAIAERVGILNDKIEVGMKLQAAEILQSGKIRFTSVLGSTEVPDVDFGCLPAQFATLSTKWITSGTVNQSADPIADLTAHIKLIKKSGRGKPRVILGEDALKGFLNNTKVQEWVKLNQYNRGEFLFEDMDSDGFSLIGVMSIAGGRVPFFTVDDSYSGKSGQTTVTADYIAAGSVIVYMDEGIYSINFGGVDKVTELDSSIASAIGNSNISLIEETVAVDYWLETEKVNTADYSGVVLKIQSSPLLTLETPDTVGCLIVSA